MRGQILFRTAAFCPPVKSRFTRIGRTPHPPQTNSPSFVPNYKGVDISLVVKVIELEVHREPDDEPVALWTSKPETASRVWGRIEAIPDWATTRGCRQDENPARWRGHLEKPAAEKVEGA